MNGLKSAPAQRWLARLSFVLAGLAIVIPVLFAGLNSLAMVAVGPTAAVVSLAAAYLFLSRRGILRWLSLAVFVLAPVAVIVVYAFRDLLWVANGGRGLVARVHDRAAGAGRGPSGLADARASGPAACPAPVPDHEPEVRGGEGGEVRPEGQGRSPWRRGAPARWAEPADFAEMACGAVDKGADLLGVAGVTVSVPAPKPPRGWARLRYLAGISGNCAEVTG
jgi:hypothetical protein